jgi:hypothetical protein
MNIRLVPLKKISIDILFCGLQKQFTTKGHKRNTKAGNENFKPYIVCLFEETKAKFLSYKNFYVPFVLWNIPIFGIVVFSFN